MEFAKTDDPSLTELRFNEDEFGALHAAARERAANSLRAEREILKTDTFVLNLKEPKMLVYDHGAEALTAHLQEFVSSTDSALTELILEYPEPQVHGLLEQREYYGMIAAAMITGLTVDFVVHTVQRDMPANAADQWLRSLG